MKLTVAGRSVEMIFLQSRNRSQRSQIAWLKSLEERYQKYLSSQQTQTDKEEDAKEAIRILDDFDAGIKEHLYEAVCRINVASNTQIDIEWTFPDLFAAEP
mgnify:CR=1 FL=1